MKEEQTRANYLKAEEVFLKAQRVFRKTMEERDKAVKAHDEAWKILTKTITDLDKAGDKYLNATRKEVINTYGD